MKIENVYAAAGLKSAIEANQKLIAEIEDYPLQKLIFQRIHGRSIDIDKLDEQTIYAIKQLIIMSLRNESQQKQSALTAML